MSFPFNCPPLGEAAAKDAEIAKASPETCEEAAARWKADFKGLADARLTAELSAARAEVEAWKGRVEALTQRAVMAWTAGDGPGEVRCGMCEGEWRTDEPDKHEEWCPVPAARRALKPPVCEACGNKGTIEDTTDYYDGCGPSSGVVVCPACSGTSRKPGEER